MRLGVVGVAALLVVTCGTWKAQAQDVKAAAVAVDAAHAAGGFDGVVVVLDHSRVVMAKAVGEANRGTGGIGAQRMTPATVFRLASLTKQVTALLVMQEVAAGKLRLDERAGEAMPALPATTGRVTVKQLLQHVSGLANPSDGPDNVVPPFYLRTGSDVGSNTATALGACAGPAKREPGMQFEYNNCDYIVLGAVLEAVTGKTYTALLEERVIRPLGLTSWGLFPAKPRGPVAVGYSADGTVELAQNPATYCAAGALFGNALDVAKWDDALLHNRLLSAQWTEVMFTADPKLCGEGLGSWAYNSPVTAPPVHVVERQGELGGTRLLNLLLPGRDAAVVLVANTEKADLFNTYSKRGVGFAVLKAWLGTPVP